jgi:hypothetical protein
MGERKKFYFVFPFLAQSTYTSTHSDTVSVPSSELGPPPSTIPQASVSPPEQKEGTRG